MVVREGAVVTKIDLSAGGASDEDVAATAVEYLQDGVGQAVSVPLAEGGRVVVTAGELLAHAIVAKDVLNPDVMLGGCRDVPDAQDP